ncbi:VanW family protein [Deinococcus sp. KNUC1210]|uniref:VanW family protein n=1 Tax=Deinococcus sp. KNUC1210 TaxID=2917691 RepID=UPI00351D937B
MTPDSFLPNAPKKPPAPRPFALTLGLVGLGVALLVGSALAFGMNSSTDTIAPGVQVGDTDLSGLNRADALSRLQAAAATVPNVVVRAGTASWTVPASQLGWTIDTQAELDAAFAASSGRSVLQKVESMLGQNETQKLPALQKIDAVQAKAALNTLTATLNTAPQNASIYFDKTRLRYAVKPGTAGVQVGVDAAVQAWAQHPEQRTLTLEQTQADPLYTSAKLQPLVDQGNLLSRPLNVRLGETGPVFTLTALQVANLYWVRTGGIELDKSAIAVKVKQIAAAVDQPAENARYTVKGNAFVKVPEKAGVVSDPAQISKLLTAAVTDPKIKSLVLTPKPSLPTLTLANLPDATKLTLIATGKSTYYHSSAARRVNVSNAAGKINGAVVAPGDNFSFLDTLGGISPENGFVTGLIISAGRTVDGLGGGVCQVSTTTFRALYQAGLPVVERNQHAYRVGYYEPQVGFEAAVYDPGKDLKMKNDTGGPILIKTINDNARSTLTVQVWGLPQTRKVSVSPAIILSETAHPAPKYIPSSALPKGQMKQVDWAADGFNLYITRTIRDGQKVQTDKVSTEYKPWQAVYEVGE